MSSTVYINIHNHKVKEKKKVQSTIGNKALNVQHSQLVGLSVHMHRNVQYIYIYILVHKNLKCSRCTTQGQ